MRTTTKKLENAVTQIKVTFDKKEWAEAQDAALKRLATRVKLDGFRPGKAPVAMIKARLGKQAIYDEATDQILQKRYADIMKKAEVAPIAQPTLNIDSVDNDNLKITILCPVKPEVELGEYKGLEVKKGRVTVAKKDIEAQKDSLMSQMIAIVAIFVGISFVMFGGMSLINDLFTHVDGQPVPLVELICLGCLIGIVMIVVMYCFIMFILSITRNKMLRAKKIFFKIVLKTCTILGMASCVMFIIWCCQTFLK